VTVLLDANVLIAAVVTEHVHHDVVEDWFIGRSEPFSTCPLTQGALVRFLLRAGATARDSLEIIDGLYAADGHEFWADALGYGDVDMRGVVGHRQVTDAYLAGLARSRGGRLVTLDRGLAALHDDVALLLDADTDAIGGRPTVAAPQTRTSPSRSRPRAAAAPAAISQKPIVR